MIRRYPFLDRHHPDYRKPDFGYGTVTEGPLTIDLDFAAAAVQTAFLSNRNWRDLADRAYAMGEELYVELTFTKDDLVAYITQYAPRDQHEHTFRRQRCTVCGVPPREAVA